MIDWDRIEELRGELGDEDFSEIASMFLDEIVETVSALQGIGDPPSLRDAYHGLKGSALNLGFAELARLCAEAEKAPGTADIAAIREACRAGTEMLRARHPGIAA